MIKPPYTKWINDIKTKLGFNRAMTASGADVVDAVNKQSAEIDNLQAAAAYVEDGDTATKKTYTVGEFILWKGLLYTVNSGGIPLGNAITGHVREVTGGGLNSLLNSIQTIKIKEFTVTTADNGSFTIPDLYVDNHALLNVYCHNNGYINITVNPAFNTYICWATQNYQAVPVTNTTLTITALYFDR